MFNQYNQKKKQKVIDPNAPPRPTLLGHEKEMKTWREQFVTLTNQNTSQSMTIKRLEQKVNRMQGQIDALISHINNISRR